MAPIANTLRRLASHLVGKSGAAQPLMDAILKQMPQRDAAALREALREHLSSANQDGNLAQIQNTAERFNWPSVEIEKLLAYGEFFSGESAKGYHRIISQGLARTDYPLFMTACIHCYKHDRYQEAKVLLEQFNATEAAGLDVSEFHAFAGYLTLAGGGTIAEATRHFDAAIDTGLVSPLLAVNAYTIYFEAGNLERVRQLRQIIQDEYAHDHEAIYAVACVELARSYYPEGFRLAEARYRMPEMDRFINPSLVSRRRWAGEPLAGRTLLLHGEQGYGDLVMMLRYIPALLGAGARLIIDSRQAALPLVEHNFPNCIAIPGDLAKPITEPFDVWTGIMSLPYHFNSTVDTIPATGGYLTVPTDQQIYWRTRVSDSAPAGIPRIGLAWSGNPGHRNDKRRSVSLEQVAPCLTHHPNVYFFALQTAVPEATPGNLLNLSEELVTLADTAALIAEMDLVITVDTSIVHLAGALGKATWLLLPHRYEWRWGLEGEHNAWYESVRVLRQRHHGDWPGLLAETFGERLPAWLASNT